MATVPFEITFKASPQNQTDYDKVKARVDGIDLLTIGQNVVKAIQPDDDPATYVISIKITGENTPPA